MNNVVIVTGGSHGIGKAIAKAFAKNKAIVIICSRTQSDLDKATSEISALGHCENMVVDVTNQDQVKKLIDYAMEKYNRIDVLVNCSGIYGPIGPLEENNLREWEETIKVNLLGTVNCTYHAIPIMKKQKSGKIINLVGGGVGSPNVMPNFTAYIASKGAVTTFTESIAKELKDFNIHVNAISPGAVNTRLLDQVLEAGDRAGHAFLEQSKKQKQDGGVPPEKAAELAVFLSTSTISGKILSAVWDNHDDINTLANNPDSSLYNLRRIDNFKFFEK